MRGTSVQISGAALLAALAACSAPGGIEAGVPALPELDGSVRVVIDRAGGHGGAGWGGPGEAAEVTVSARFLRFRDVDPTTAELLAGGEPEPQDGCQLPAGPAAVDDLLATLPDGARVEHLDAGEISVVFEGVAVSTTPTRLPALSPWVDGVEYDEQVTRLGPVSRGGDPVAPLESHGADPRGGEIAVAGFGGQHVGPFEVAVAVPSGRPMAMTEPDLIVTWPVSPGDGRDEVVLRVAGAIGPVCRGADRGMFRVPASLLPARGTLTVELERVRHAGLDAPGMAGAEVEVVVRDVLSVWRP